MNHHYNQHQYGGLSTFGRPEYDANGVLRAGMAATPPKYRLFALGAAVCFGAGVVAGVILDQHSPHYPETANVCRADEVGDADCIPAAQLHSLPEREDR